MTGVMLDAHGLSIDFNTKMIFAWFTSIVSVGSWSCIPHLLIRRAQEDGGFSLAIPVASFLHTKHHIADEHLYCPRSEKSRRKTVQVWGSQVFGASCLKARKLLLMDFAILLLCPYIFSIKHQRATLARIHVCAQHRRQWPHHKAGAPCIQQ